jgi:hypothetical protein
MKSASILAARSAALKSRNRAERLARFTRMFLMPPPPTEGVADEDSSVRNKRRQFGGK